MKTVLVTGGSGFIGRHVIEELLDRGYKVLSFDRSKTPLMFLKVDGAGESTQVTNFYGDIRDRNAVDEAVRNVDGAINLAGLLGTAEAVDDPFPAAETNIFGGLNFLTAVKKYNKPAVQIAVGNHFENNTYSITKTTIERFALMFNKEHETRVAVVRGLNAYGPGQHHKPIRKITPNFVTSALRGEPIKIYGDGEQIMDMIFVRDLAKILVSALEYAEKSESKDLLRVFEAGTGRRSTVNEIAGVVASAVEFESNPYSSPNDPRMEHVPMRAGESDRAVVVGDPDTLEPLGFSVNDLTTLEHGMLETVQWYYKNYQWQQD